MAKYKIAVIRGDGIGIEVMEEGLKILNAVADRYDITWDFVEFPWGSDYYFEHGHMMPPDALDILSGVRPDLSWRSRAPRHPRPPYAQRAFAAYPAQIRSVRLRATKCPLSRHQRTAQGQRRLGHRSRGDKGEHRGRVCQRRRISVPRVPRRDRRTGWRIHPPRLRACHHPRLRASPGTK